MRSLVARPSIANAVIYPLENQPKFFPWFADSTFYCDFKTQKPPITGRLLCSGQ